MNDGLIGWSHDFWFSGKPWLMANTKHICPRVEWLGHGVAHSVLFINCPVALWVLLTNLPSVSKAWKPPLHITTMVYPNLPNDGRETASHCLSWQFPNWRREVFICLLLMIFAHFSILLSFSYWFKRVLCTDKKLISYSNPLWLPQLGLFKTFTDIYN